ncbi:uncharacterized protein LOC131151840 isoform X2 [Malania oleifera]|uniref:uncharacterized protein LOC131151840 isoform X2 n=1 Tax=Malania oleifera TaxID=397392 RepID=UPI0025AECB3F|nr:uncharacterized protein LOC131151840 isoform X2 [Malania oleifera]
MENTWQIKCSPAWQPLGTPSVASSSQIPQQESRNQMEPNIGHFFYPHVAQEPRSAAWGLIQESFCPNSSNFTPYASGPSELGSSCLALLSGPPPLLHCDYQQFPNPIPFPTSSKFLINGSSIMVGGATGSGVRHGPAGPLSENWGNQILRNVSDLCSGVSSRSVVSTNHCNASVSHDDLQAAKLNLHSSDLAKGVIHHIVPGTEKVNDFSSSRGALRACASLSNFGKVQGSSILASQRESLELSSSVSLPPALTRGCPRVFCLGTSGDLLLSNTGLLGVVCFCHQLHLSVAKFCEHSGLFDVNPGDAVRVDSGETIAQWRKLYFQKLGIRVPEDHSGWNWPEGFSPTGNLVKYSGSAPNTSKSSDLLQVFGSSGGLVRSGEPRNDALFTPISRKLMDDVSRNEREDSQGSSSSNFLFKGLFGASQSNLHAVANSQLTGCPMSRCSTIPALVGRGQDKGCHSISACFDSISKTGNPFDAHKPLQNLGTYRKDFDTSRFNDPKEGVVARNGAVPSSIELRLGQPYQQGQTLGNPVVPVMGPQQFDTLGDSRKLHLQDQLIHESSSRALEDFRQYLQHATATSNSNARMKHKESNFPNHAFEVSNALDPTKLVQGNVAKSSVISMLLSHGHTPFIGNVHSKMANNTVSGSDQFMSRALHCESHITKSDSVNFSWNRGDGMERQLNINDPFFNNYYNNMEKSRGVGCAPDGSCVRTEPSFQFPKQMKNSSSFAAAGKNGNPTTATAHDNNCCSLQLSGIPSDASHLGRSFSDSGKVSCAGDTRHLDHLLLQSASSPMGFGQILPSLAVGFSSASSVSVPNMTVALPDKEWIGISSCMQDENLKLLALRHFLELSKREHAVACIGINQERRKFDSSSNVGIQGSAVDLSAPEEKKRGSNRTNNHDSSESAMKSLHSGANCLMSGDIEKLAPLAALNNLYDLSTSIPGASLHAKEFDMQCQHSHDSLPNEHPSLRVGGSGNVTSSSEKEKCCQRLSYACIQGKCSCTVHANCLAVDCELKGKTSLNAFEEHISNVNSKPCMSASKCEKDLISLKKNTTALDLSGKLKIQIPKKVDSHTSEWRDVPSKVLSVCNLTSIDCLADALSGKGTGADPPADMQEADFLMEQDMSNISSGCSAPAVTQASVELNNVDSCIVDAGDIRYENDGIVDEGSGIHKCLSSDDALDSGRTSESDGVSDSKMTNLENEGSSEARADKFCSLLDELKLRDSFRMRKVGTQIHTGVGVHEIINHAKNVERGLKTGKRKGTVKWKMLPAPFPANFFPAHFESAKCTGTEEWCHHSSKNIQVHLQSHLGIANACSPGPSCKRRRSALSSVKTPLRKRDLCWLYAHGEGQDEFPAKKLKGNAGFLEIPEGTCGKKSKSGWTANSIMQLRSHKPSCADAGKNSKGNAISCINAQSNRAGTVCNRKARPVVCGKFGVISNAEATLNMSKLPKIVSLDKILKAARTCTLPEVEEPRITSIKELKITGFGGGDGFSNWKKQRNSESNNNMGGNEVDAGTHMDAREKACSSGVKRSVDEVSMLDKDGDDGRTTDNSILDGHFSAQVELKGKEIRKRSIYELLIKGKNSSSEKLSLKISKCALQTKCRSMGRFLKNSGDGHYISELSKFNEVNANKSIKEDGCESFILDSDAFCCVCGSSDKDEINCLLECNRCLIRVHQACYGVSRVPKYRWYCRPCKTNSKDIVCVLCGYGGGAMTQALRSQNFVKSLLKAWKIFPESHLKNTSTSEVWKDNFSMMNFSRSGLEDSVPVLKPLNVELSSIAMWQMVQSSKLYIVKNSPCSQSNIKVHNSVTAGLLDSTVKQWVHMVCGLWTPGTRCPNVDTMNAFDVSGALCPRVNVVCSICNRPGGSCIQCRVLNCSVRFHPWCAHQQGLLQSEVEGVDNESVGFYGRCMVHAKYPLCESYGNPTNMKLGCPVGKESTCARTEGYKGRKQEGFQHNLYGQSNGNGGYLVPQEQINAWLHINGPKSCTKGLPKLPLSDIECDCRKEYARYKQTRGWKNLVVYKSGIHALGLYTCQFISRGAMVVEYIGEIVGLRVADKRESEYQSGKRLQYKSACYFFRIDKEHIIDATRKGGIARFVNHSCLVVFFAERDIYPGEEITYDYHFNHEDEGKKIPCFCNSKNCRRYMN